jgi:RNA polymerase sigma-70 factor (ECF subfamily)
MALGLAGHALRELDLSPEQRSQVRTLVRAAREGGLMEAGEQLHAARHALEWALWDPATEDAGLRALRAAAAEAEDRVFALRRQLAHDVLQVLTEDQRAQLPPGTPARDETPPGARHGRRWRGRPRHPSRPHAQGDGDAATRLLRRHGASMLATAAPRARGARAGRRRRMPCRIALIAAWSTDALPTGDVGGMAARHRRAQGPGRPPRRSRRLAEDPLPPEEAGSGASRGCACGGRAGPRLPRLSPADRAVLVLVEVEGLSMAEAARGLGTTTMAVKWRAVRARRRLRALLTGEHDA